MKRADKTKCSYLVKRKVIFHRENAPDHTSRLSAYVHEPHSPDLPASDYFLFHNLKKWFATLRFASNDEVIEETNVDFAEFILNVCIVKVLRSCESDGLRVFIQKETALKIKKNW